MLISVSGFIYIHNSVLKQSVSTLISPKYVSKSGIENLVVFEVNDEQFSLYCPTIVKNLINENTAIGSIIYESYANHSRCYIKKIFLID